MQCPKCHNEVERGEKFCTHCGYELKKKKIDKKIIALICAVIVVFLISNFGMYALKKHINFGSSVNDKFIEAVENEDYKKAFKLTNLKEIEFINPETFKKFIEEKHIDYSYINNNKGLKIDFLPFTRTVELELPRGSKLWLNGKEITDTKEIPQSDNITFRIGDIFVCTHELKITSPLAKDYNEAFDLSYFVDGSDYGLLHIKASSFLYVKDEYIKDIEAKSQIAISEVLTRALKDDSFNSSYEIRNKEDLKDNLFKNRINQFKIVDVGFGIPNLQGNDTAQVTAFTTIKPTNSSQTVLTFIIELQFVNDNWEVSLIEYQSNN